MGNQVITTTDEHPFWINGKGWVKAKDLKIGDKLVTDDNSELSIEKIEVKKEHRKVYNFRVKDFHTYYVSNLRIWTHNTDACGSWGDGPANYYAYYGMKDGKAVYVGITNDLQKRSQQHGDRFDELKPINTEAITRRQSRALEQYQINQNPQFTNKINSISTRRVWYNSAINWAKAWFEDEID